MILGVAFLFTENIENADKIVWPVAIMCAGAWMVLKQKHRTANPQFAGTEYKEF